MNYFINLKNGVASIATSRDPQALCTDMSDIISQIGDEQSENLTTSLNMYIEEECKKIDLSSWFNREYLEAIVFLDYDFLDQLEYYLDLDFICDYPELRDPQNDLILDRLCELDPVDLKRQMIINELLESKAKYVKTTISIECCDIAIAIQDIECIDEFPDNFEWSVCAFGLDVDDY